MALVRCPSCAKLFDPQQSRAMPFCSERCRRIDLNRWLDEEISLPYRELDEGGSPKEPADEDDD